MADTTKLYSQPPRHQGGVQSFWFKFSAVLIGFNLLAIGWWLGHQSGNHESSPLVQETAVVKDQVSPEKSASTNKPFLGSNPPPLPASLPELSARIQPSVITVIALDEHDKRVGTGTGFFVDKRGFIATNYHVIENAKRADAQLSTGERIPITGVIIANESTDLVVLKVALDHVDKFLPLATSAGQTPVGSKIVIVGSPLGMDGTLSEGIVSAHRSDVGNTPLGQSLLQISAPISPGSSGSPVVEVNSGEVIGIATMVLVSGQQMNFAVPIESLRDLLPSSETHVATLSVSDLQQAEWQRISLSPEGRRLRQAWEGSSPAELPTIAKRYSAAFPRSAVTHFRVGWNLWGETYNDEECIHFFRVAAQLKPSYFDAWYWLSWTLQGAEEKKSFLHEALITPKITPLCIEAYAAIQKAIELRPESGKAWTQLARIETYRRQHAAAIKAYEKALSCSDESSDAMGARQRVQLHINYAKALRALDRFDDALASLHEATLLVPSDYDAWYQMALTRKVMALRFDTLRNLAEARSCAIKAKEVVKNIEGAGRQAESFVEEIDAVFAEIHSSETLSSDGRAIREGVK